MPATLVVARGPAVYLVGAGPSDVRELATGAPRTGASEPPRPGSLTSPEDLPVRALREEIDRSPGGSEPLAALGPRFAGALAQRVGRPVAEASPAQWQAALRRLPPWPREERRSYLLGLATARLGSVLRSPEEIVVSFAREEQRLERAMEREERAAEAFVSPPGTELEVHARDWSVLRGQLREHHRRLAHRLEVAASSLLPNLAAVVGPRIAARLLAAAGGLAPLGRISASRLQLLGSRRRPSPERGPRYGLLYRAECLDEVPPDRRAAFARSVAALAAIAARADVTTRAPIAPGLVARRDRRAAQLRRGGRR